MKWTKVSEVVEDTLGETMHASRMGVCITALGLSERAQINGCMDNVLDPVASGQRCQ
jgi:hypothetical protein